LYQTQPDGRLGAARAGRAAGDARPWLGNEWAA
jgi:hypothetical protein